MNWTEADYAAYRARRSLAPDSRTASEKAVVRVVNPAGKGKAATGAESLEFTLPMPPTLNHAYPTVNGHRVLSATGRSFKAYAQRETENQALVQGWRYPAGARISLTLRLVMPRKRFDISNIIKITEDSIAAGLGFDDSAVWLLVVERLAIDKANPRCDVTVGIFGG